MVYDYIIVGQGLSGTVLAHTLIRAGNSVLILDDVPIQSSSLICGGLFNPITGKRLVKTWMADEIFPFLNRFYSGLESELGEQLIWNLEIKVPIHTEERWKEAENRLKSDDYRNWMVLKEEQEVSIYEVLKGTMSFHPSGYVDVEKMIVLSRNKWKSEGIFAQKSVEWNQVSYSNEIVTIGDFRAKRLICCEGYKAIHNPYFCWVPFAPVKGELLEIKAEGLSDSNILKSKGVFVLPLGHKRYKIGATYVWDDLSEAPTEAGQSEIMEKYNLAFSAKANILRHFAGIRPAVKDRRPVIGNHPEFTQIGIFNGMGTKGVSLAPYFADKAAGFWNTGIPLDVEISVSRFENQFRTLQQHLT